MFETNFLFASLLWGTIGVGCIAYGKKQGAAPPLIAGFCLLAVSFVPSAWLMSGIAVLLLSGMIWGIKQGY